jgi:hypothetical protein
MAIGEVYMSHSVTGVVTNSFNKTKKTRAGDKTIWYITVDGMEISTGFSKEFDQNEHVSIGVEFKYGEWQYNRALPATGPAATARTAEPAKKSFGGASKGTFPVKPTDGQMSIIRQNSMNRAVEILDNWMSTCDESGVPMWYPANQDEYMQKLHEVALIVTDFNSGQDIMKLKAAKAAYTASGE